jgi:hypothetical protein
MHKFLFLLIFSFGNNFAKSSTINYSEKSSSDPIKKIVREMAKSNVYEISNAAGYAGSRSQQSSRYDQLLKAASTEELTSLATKHKNPVVRLYAFNALVQKLKDVPVAIVEQFRNDATIIVVSKNGASGKAPLNSVAEGLLY